MILKEVKQLGLLLVDASLLMMVAAVIYSIAIIVAYLIGTLFYG